VGCAANFGNGDTRIGFVQQVQNLVVCMLGVSHRRYAFMSSSEALIMDCRCSLWFLSTRLGYVFSFR
jgi:hypothetical protein